MKSKFSVYGILIVALLAVSLSGCAGIEVGTGETVTALYRAVLDAPGTMIFKSGDSYIIAWQHGSKYAVYGLGQVSQDLLSANSVKLSVESLSAALNKGGWESIPPSMLPPFIIEQVLTAARAVGNGIMPSPILYVPCPECMPQSGEITG